jgi:tripartite-type tricarboxylate transporter receptor subunit TctC
MSMRVPAYLLYGLMALAGGVCQSFAADDYPTKPVKIVVPYPPGGTTDIIARLISQKLSEGLGQPLIIDNKPGAGGIIGTSFVAKAPADGYTLDFGNIGPNAINPSMYPNLPYDPKKDFAPISIAVKVPFLLVTPPSVAAKTVRELIELGKARPGQLTFASVGNGSLSHVTGEFFNSMAGTKFNHVPYKGGAPALQDTVAGLVTFMFATGIEATPHVKSGKLRALAVSSAQRSPVAPELPTIMESGLPGFEVEAWFGLLAPAGTPVAIINRLNREIIRALNDPDTRDRLLALSAVPAPTTPAEFAAVIDADIARWAKVVKESGAKVD